MALELELPIRGSALNLAHISVKPLSICGATCCQPVLTPEEALQMEDYMVMDLLRHTPCPSMDNLEQVRHNWVASSHYPFCSIQVHHLGSTTILPAWAMTFWQPVASHWGDIFWWNKASEMLMQVECHKAYILLSTIPWSIRSPIPGVQIKNLAQWQPQLGWWVSK